MRSTGWLSPSVQYGIVSNHLHPSNTSSSYFLCSSEYDRVFFNQPSFPLGSLHYSKSFSLQQPPTTLQPLFSTHTRSNFLHHRFSRCPQQQQLLPSPPPPRCPSTTTIWPLTQSIRLLSTMMTLSPRSKRRNTLCLSHH